MPYTLGVFGSHVVQYKAPLYRRLAESEAFDVTVAYGSRAGVDETDLGFGEDAAWDVDLLDGYDHQFLRNYAGDDAGGFFSRVNPAVWSWVDPDWDALWLHAGCFTVSSLVAAVSAKSKGVPVLLHNPSHLRNGPLTVQAARRAYVGTFLTCVDAVLADCSRNRTYFERLGADPDDIYTFPCAVDNERFQRARRELDESTLAERRERLGLGDSTVVLFVGKLVDRKRPGDVLRAVAGLSGDVTALVVGDGPLRAELERFAETEPVDAVFTGFKNQSELPVFYELADVFVIPSEYDPSPKAMNEAMNFELPVVATDGVGTADDMIGDNGRVYSVGNVRQLESVLDTIVTHDDLRERMGRQSLATVREWDFAADVSVLEEVLAEVTA